MVYFIKMYIWKNTKKIQKTKNENITDCILDCGMLYTLMAYLLYMMKSNMFMFSIMNNKILGNEDISLNDHSCNKILCLIYCESDVKILLENIQICYITVFVVSKMINVMCQPLYKNWSYGTLWEFVYICKKYKKLLPSFSCNLLNKYILLKTRIIWYKNFLITIGNF